jgi:hypothetical protein
MKVYILLVLFISLVSMSSVEVGEAWQVNDDCNPPYQTCNSDTLKCENKSVFPLEFSEFLGSVILGLLIALANAGGAGGGEVIVPILMIFFQVALKQAVALSNFWIFWGGLTRFVVNFNQKNPNKDTKTIDYGIVMVMFPMILLGSLFGVQINVLLPDTVLLIGLSLILLVLSLKSGLTLLKIWKKESAKVQENPKIDESPKEAPIQQQKDVDNVESKWLLWWLFSEITRCYRESCEILTWKKRGRYLLFQ